MKKINYVSGEELNGFIFVKDIDAVIESNGRKRRAALFICKECKKEFQSRIVDIKGGAVLSCGCKRVESAKIRFTKHNLKSHKVYTIWRNIIQRCYDKKSKSYKTYGNIGVNIYNTWRNDFMPFFTYVTSLNGYDESKIGNGSDNISIDRINTYGNYEPGNLKWSNKKEQNNNRRK